MFKTAAQVQAETLATARTAARSRVETGHRTALAELVERFPQTERDGWHELINDAKQGKGECIKQYANALEISVEQAVRRIKDAREKYRTAYGKATGTLTRLRDQIDASETVEQLNAIQWPKDE